MERRVVTVRGAPSPPHATAVAVQLKHDMMMSMGRQPFAGETEHPAWIAVVVPAFHEPPEVKNLRALVHWQLMLIGFSGSSTVERIHRLWHQVGSIAIATTHVMAALVAPRQGFNRLPRRSAGRAENAERVCYGVQMITPRRSTLAVGLE